jgi:hypothetical protein
MATPQTPPTLASPLILPRPDGRWAILFDAAPAAAMPPARKVKPEGTTYTIVGYRQTAEPAVRGGKANRQAIRFRNGGLRAMARTFRGQPFLTGHNWSDARARGGTVLDAWVDEVDGELLMLFEVLATEDWAIRGFESGTIDRFSIGADFVGEILCTLHDAPIWSEPECRCWPGMEVDGQVVEFEVEDGTGLEVSAVNVAAVDDTYVVAALGARPAELDDATAQHLHAARVFGERCGRAHPAIDQLAMGGAPAGGFRAPRPQPRMAPDEPPGGNAMDRALICKQLGLAATATDEEIFQRMTTLGADAAQAGVLRAQLEQSAADRQAESEARHVDAELAGLQASHQVTDKVITQLRTAAAPPGGRAAFDAALALVRESAPRRPAAADPTAAPPARAALQSDAKPAPGPAAAALEDGPDAFELTRDNPHLGRFMKAAKLSADQVRQHGARTFHVVPNLRDLAEATIQRG